MSEETIFALSTPPGRGGIAVVRVSGPGAKDSILKLTGGYPRTARTAEFRALKRPDTGALIDRGLTIFFEKPASFTGEDVAEFHLHGGRAVTEALLAALAGLPGFRPAEPGEFTRRAFEHGRMDLTEAEAVADLIDAETQAQKDQALAQMGGALSTLYDDWRDRLTDALAHLEADIDFPDEDLPEGVADQVRPQITKLHAEIREHLNDNRRGERLRNGIHVAVIGAPNAGKSSLVNTLAQREVAIVSEHAGTTRDVIEVHLDLGGFPVILSDTAGLRPDQLGTGAQASIESEGIRRAIARAEEADIKILLFDATTPSPDRHTLALADKNSLIVFNKCDVQPARHALEGGHMPPLSISVKSGHGLGKLAAALVDKIKEIIGDRAAPSPTRARHRQALENCAASLENALTDKDTELIAEDVRIAVRY
ncbi:MAG TPA: tRNA uridine-5-carboxymethylaminomethyl(34) synthesis GTPase MnmE, partial [Patescibacteria group bacterium]|nr:tRNA uridine-5-carboxymethylaminomethyl(34) synthesis GTPase MnmE [Patescibacteria group bacterium]